MASQRALLVCLLLAVLLFPQLCSCKHSSSSSSSTALPSSSSSSAALPPVSSSTAAPHATSAHHAQSTAPSASSGFSLSSSAASAGSGKSGNSSKANSSSSTSTAPDVYLNVPNLSVGSISLIVEQLTADINLNANVANLVTINAGVAVSIQKVNLTIIDVQAELELIVRLGHLVDIVNRVFESLDLNPLLISAINDVTEVVDTVAGVVSGLLGSITQSGTTVSFIVDNLGNIVQSVLGSDGSAVGQSSIVGNYLSNMSFTGVTQTLANGNVLKQYQYSPLNALVNIIFNSAGQILSTSVVSSGSGTGTAGGGSSSSSSTGGGGGGHAARSSTGGHGGNGGASSSSSSGH